MKSFLLKIKSWQLFLLICFVPFIIAIIYELISSSLTNHNDGILNNPLFALTIYFLYMLWIYSIADFFTKLLNQTPKYLKISFAISVIYIVYYSFFVISHLQYIASTGVATLFHFTFQILFMIIFFYLPYHASKALRAVELNHEVSFRDAFADFFCLLLFPFGVWFVQPRVRKLYLMKMEDIKANKTT
jgi:hypothetical protein